MHYHRQKVRFSCFVFSTLFLTEQSNHFTNVRTCLASRCYYQRKYIRCLLPFAIIKNPSLRRCHGAVTIFGWLCGPSDTTAVLKSPSQNSSVFDSLMQCTKQDTTSIKKKSNICSLKTIKIWLLMVEEKALVNIADRPAHKKAVVKIK